MAGRSIAGRYRIRSRHDVAAFGTRFVASRADGGPCLLLVLRPEIGALPDANARFEALIARLGALPPASFVEVYEAGVARDGTLYLAEEPAGPLSLAEILKKQGQLTPAESVEIGRQIAVGLGILHTRGAEHGGVTAAAILIDEPAGATSPRARLRDTGLATLAADLPRGAIDRYDPALAALLADNSPANPAERDRRALAGVLYRCVTGSALEPATQTAALEHLRNLHGGLAALVGELLGLPPADDHPVPDDLPGAGQLGARMRETMRGVGIDAIADDLPIVPPARPKSLRVTPVVAPTPAQPSGGHNVPRSQAVEAPPPMPSRRMTSKPSLPGRRPSSGPGAAAEAVDSAEARAAMVQGSPLAAALHGRTFPGPDGGSAAGREHPDAPLPDAPPADRSAPSMRATSQGIGADPTQAAAGEVPDEKRSPLAETLQNQAPSKLTMLPWAGDPPTAEELAQPIALPSHMRALVASATGDTGAPPTPSKAGTLLPGALPAGLQDELRREAEQTAADGTSSDHRDMPSGISVSESGAYLPWKTSGGRAPVDVSLPDAYVPEELPSEPDEADDPPHGAGAVVVDIDPGEVDSIDDIMAVDSFFSDPNAAPKQAETVDVSQPAVELEQQQAGARRWLPMVALVLVLLGVAFWYQYRQTLDATSASVAEAPVDAAPASATAVQETAASAESGAPSAAAPQSVANAASGAAGDERGPEQASVSAVDEPVVARAQQPIVEQPAEEPEDPSAIAALPASMQRVAGGGYNIGCSPAIDRCNDDAMPTHSTRLRPFGLLTREVTVAEYRECVAAGQCPASGRGESCTGVTLDGADRPVTCVDWAAASSYCAFRGWRLPTEAEWEIAARGPRQRQYPWGSQWPSCERTVMSTFEGAGCGTGRPRVAGSTPADVSWVQVRDLGGNVSEWVADDYAPYPGAPPAAEQTDAVAGHKVFRGGAYTDSARTLAVVHERRHAKPSTARPDIGVRCAVSLQPAQPGTDG